jgi:hypothetical protein
MNPKTTEEFKVNLSRLMMDAAKSEGDKIDQLTAAIEKLASKSEPAAASKHEATTLVGYDQPSSSGYQNQPGSGYFEDRGRGFRGGYRGRGRGRGRGHWNNNYRPQYNNNWYGNQSYGYGYQPQQQYFQPRSWQPRGQRFMPPMQQMPPMQFQAQYPMQWMPRPAFQQSNTGRGNENRVAAPQQAYMIEAPVSCPATPAQQPQSSSDAEVASFFSQFPENQ